MNTLFSLQEMFQNYLLSDSKIIEQHIVNSEKISAAKRLDIYRDAYRIRLIECLASNYPTLKTYIGFKVFQTIGNAYLEKNPSSYRSIRWFGDNFSSFLKELAEDCLAELAQFEWCLSVAFDAADAKIVTMEEMTRVSPSSWANMRFLPHPSLQQECFYWNIVPIWQAIANQQTPPEPNKKLQPVSWVIWRSNYMSRFYSLAADESWALNAMIQGANFGEICAGLCEWHDEEQVGMQAASLLKGWIQSELLSEIKLDQESS
ncbi:HvfC/BufC N-terminal domain-containing protein [Legionella hackeliae]|uniref:Putative DNA-binding domain-containing protein n=1 Tax=Legionella hackeliae TaxID=449 RepID=A0A0A8UWH2_LEGHA|nr:DNA-binding domain-containing protein [Legionella hackeliae]KTD15188.1 hypothetical protein Lhac_0030 [Legionella hackeliae]CEK11447.1 conserved protein of unknown function [Legionella hackeliae]STX48219.1 Uncharacterized protein conserved in bacteria [Legionella hackeliae]